MFLFFLRSRVHGASHPTGRAHLFPSLTFIALVEHIAIILLSICWCLIRIIFRNTFIWTQKLRAYDVYGFLFTGRVKPGFTDQFLN